MTIRTECLRQPLRIYSHKVARGNHVFPKRYFRFCEFVAVVVRGVWFLVLSSDTDVVDLGIWMKRNLDHGERERERHSETLYFHLGIMSPTLMHVSTNVMLLVNADSSLSVCMVDQSTRSQHVNWQNR